MENMIQQGTIIDTRLEMCYERLFNHMAHEHGLTLLESEMDEIVRICSNFNKKLYPTNE